VNHAIRIAATVEFFNTIGSLLTFGLSKGWPLL
jgi:hypothetical protein